VVIRTVLVPSIMQLFGARAWWLPDWPARILPRISVESQEPPPGVQPAGEQA
jgi:RND superfamily putative drug exporter